MVERTDDRNKLDRINERLNVSDCGKDQRRNGMRCMNIVPTETCPVR